MLFRDAEVCSHKSDTDEVLDILYFDLNSTFLILRAMKGCPMSTVKYDRIVPVSY